MSFGGGIPGMSGGTPRMPRAPRAPRAPRMPRAPRAPRAPRPPRFRNPFRSVISGYKRLFSRIPFLNRIGAKQRDDAPDAAAVATSRPAGGASATDDGASGPAPLVAASDPLRGDLAGPSVGVAGIDGDPDVARAPRRLPHHAPGPDATRAERRAARRAARRLGRERMKDSVPVTGLWASLLEVGRAQWLDAFDPSGLDQRFVPFFDARQRIVVTVPRDGDARSVVGPGGVVMEATDDRMLVVGELVVDGFDPDGQRFVGSDPSEGRIAQRPVFVLRSASRREPVAVTDDMHVEGVEQRTGRFQLLAGASITLR